MDYLKNKRGIDFISNHGLFLIIIFFQLIFWFIVRNDPFFGDGISTVSRAAVTIFDQNLQTIFYLPEHDPGHPTLFPWFLALIWTVFGKSLWISHLFNLTFVLAALIALRKVSGFFLPKQIRDLPLLLISCYSVFLAQSAMILTHMALTAFFLFALHSLLIKNRKWFVFNSSLLLLVHLEGVFLFIILFLIDIVNHKRNIVREFKHFLTLYLIPSIFFVLWLFFHFQKTGWLVSSPNYSEHRALSTFVELLKNILLSIWRIADYGFVVLFFSGFILIKKKFTFKPNTIWTIIMISGLFLILSISLFLSNSIAHRYFLPLQVLICIGIIDLIKRWDLKRIYLFVSGISFLLLAGNFLNYPGKCMGDATLAYRSYFILQEKVIQMTKGNEVYTFAPVYNPSKFVYLEQKGLNVKPITDQNLNDLSYIMVNSFVCDVPINISNTIKNWHGNSFISGSVYISIYANPIKVNKGAFWELRKASEFEQWMIEQKAKLK